MIGAQVEGVDIHSSLSDEVIQSLRRALLEHHVLFFRDQRLEAAQLHTFGERFGTPRPHYSAPDGVDGHPGLVRIHTDANSPTNEGGGWHSDSSFDDVPPMGSILHLHTAPPLGGDTLFANLAAVYESLSPSMQAFLGSLTAVHDSGPPYQKYFKMRAEDMPQGRFNSAVHPVVRTHPETGRRVLYVSRYFTTRLVELEPSESDALLDYLFSRIEQPRFHCRFKWQKNSVAFWDNRITQHHALWDYYPSTRTGIRYTIAGDRPFLA